jgi:hypothetical protein
LPQYQLWSAFGKPGAANGWDLAMASDAARPPARAVEGRRPMGAIAVAIYAASFVVP